MWTPGHHNMNPKSQGSESSSSFVNNQCICLKKLPFDLCIFNVVRPLQSFFVTFVKVQLLNQSTVWLKIQGKMYDYSLNFVLHFSHIFSLK